MSIEHRNIADADLHEPKGVAGAANNSIYVANGSGSGVWKPAGSRVEHGFWNYDDAATATTPISITAAGIQYELTNDGLGPATNKTYAASGITDIWDTTTNRFDFSGLSLGDTVDIRLDIDWTTTSTTNEVNLFLELGIGGTPYQIPFVSDKNLKNIGTHRIVGFNGIYMGDTNTLNNPARFLAQCDATGSSIVVHGWYVRVLRNGA